MPNALSVARILLAIALPFTPPAWWAAIILAAGVTDWGDGFVARRFGASSWAGGLLDAAGDKAFTLSALVTLTTGGPLEPWHLAPLFLRDLATLSIAVFAVVRRDWDRFHVMPSRLLGKCATVAFFVLFMVLSLWPGATEAHTVIILTTALFSAVSAGDYVFVGIRGMASGDRLDESARAR